jgi:hypothetical protein
MQILSDARDEYMLNPCKAKIWFVVELCEPIQPSAIELANFELYSSTPKEIQIEGSDKYPSQEWSQLGSFEASESRELQRFQIKSQSQYMKFIRISLHSHYGSEHYCPVSLIRAFGISLAEEFDTIESGGAPVSPGITSPFVPPVQQQQQEQVQPQPLQPHQQPPPDQVLSNESVDDITAGTVKMTGASDVPLSDLLSNKASGPDERPADAAAAAADTNSMQLTDPDHGCQESDILLMGDKIESSCQASGARGGTAAHAHVPDPAPSPTPTVDQAAAAAIDSLLSPTPVLIEVAEINSRITSTSTGTAAAAIVPDITELPTPGHDSLSSSGSEAIGVTVGQETVTVSGADAVTPSDMVTSIPTVSPSPPESDSQQSSQSPQQLPEPAAAVPPPPPSPSPPPVLQGPAHVMNESSTGSVIAASSSKESIFIRLNNRIKALELNMSLNREAIESIVRKQDMFEHRINDLMNRTQVQEEEGQRLIIDLQLKLNDISEQVYLLVSEKEVFHWQLIQVHILLMVIEIAIIIMIMNTFMKKILSAAAIPQQMSSCHHVDHDRVSQDVDAGSSSCVTPTKVMSPSRSLFRSLSRSTPDKSSLLPDHHPITGAALLKKKRKRKKKKKSNQENVPPPPPSPVVADADHQQQLLQQPHENAEPQLLINGKIADIG